ncbi:MAG: CheR family methyltransferase [Sphaerochaeta sp.]|nr:CheR family methyltransferase [Sphaerochaeta sp.]
MNTARYPKIHSYIEHISGISTGRGSLAITDKTIATLMVGWRCEKESDFLHLLETDRAKYDEFIHHITVNETYFFRENGHYTLLKSKIIPEVLNTQDQVTILSAGCSNGAEIYSAYICLTEILTPSEMKKINFIGIDIDQRSLDKAKKGLFSRNQLREIPEDQINSLFTKIRPLEYQLNEVYRSKVSFQRVNLIAIEEISALPKCDIIFYRNVAIYFSEEKGSQVLNNLASILSESGVLFTSSTEIFPSKFNANLSLHISSGIYYFSKKPSDTMHGFSVPHTCVKSTTVQPKKANIILNTSRRKEKTETPPVSVSQIITLALQGNTHTANLLLDRYEQFNTVSIDSRILRAGIYLEGDDKEAADALCHAIMRDQPARVEPYILLSITQRQNKDFHSALKYLRSATYIDKDCWIAHFYAAEILRSLHDQNRARKRYQLAHRALELHADKEYLLLTLYNDHIRREIKRLCELHQKTM